MPAPFPIPPNSPNLREVKLASVLNYKYFPIALADVTHPELPIAIASIETGVGSYDPQGQLVSVLTIATTFPGT